MDTSKHGTAEIDAILQLIDDGLGDSPARLSSEQAAALAEAASSEELLGAIEKNVAAAEAAEEEPVRVGPGALGKLTTGRSWGWPSRQR